MNAVIRAGESYARIPVAIHSEGLHCDSLYALPLKMESCKSTLLHKLKQWFCSL